MVAGGEYATISQKRRTGRVRLETRRTTSVLVVVPVRHFDTASVVGGRLARQVFCRMPEIRSNTAALANTLF
jgi:hypothetical protein